MTSNKRDHVVTALLDAAQHDFLEQVAAGEQRSVSSVVRQLVEERRQEWADDEDQAA
jgi:Arc/MetJ-type ribon-helix-helix transcriptional regulator